MNVAIPLAIELGSDEYGDFVPVQEVVRRIEREFPATRVDWARGREHATRRLQRLIDLRTPEVILLGSRDLVDKTAFVEIPFPDWPGHVAAGNMTGIDPGVGQLWFEVEPFDIRFLQAAAPALAAALDLQFSLVDTWSGNMQVTVDTGPIDPMVAARTRYGGAYAVEENRAPPALIALPDWRNTCRRAIALWLARSTDQKGVQAMTAGFASNEAMAEQAVEELATIGQVRRAWSIDIPCYTHQDAILLDQGDWMTGCYFGGVPKGVVW